MRNVLVLLLSILVAGTGTWGCSHDQMESDSVEDQKKGMNEDSDTFPIKKSEKEWRNELTEEEYHILREEGTEPRGSGDLLDVKADGVFVCAACGNELFESSEKYESNTGWPSFWDVTSESAVKTRPDHSLWRTRTEVVCAQCGGHLGHVFEDGPEPTGLRYCINSLALDFEEASNLSDDE